MRQYAIFKEWDLLPLFKTNLMVVGIQFYYQRCQMSVHPC